MTDALSLAVADINRLKNRTKRLQLFIELLRAFLLGMLALSVWTLINPASQFEQLFLALLVAAISFFFRGRRRQVTVDLENLALSLEIQNPDMQTSAMRLRDVTAQDLQLGEWRGRIAKHMAELRLYEAKRLLAQLSTLVVPLVFIGICWLQAVPSLSMALAEVKDVVARFSQGASLKIIQGATKEEESDKSIALENGKKVTVELLAQNLIEINVATSSRSAVPTIELKRLSGTKKEDAVFQSFQMLPRRSGFSEGLSGDQKSDGKDLKRSDRYTISFAVSEPVELVVPSISSDSVALLKVQQLPIPKVEMTVTSDLEDPWPDDQPLGLKIVVNAENPLQTVRLIIRSGQRVSKELVANVMAEDKKDLETDYRLILETYVESDMAEVELIAEAVDRAVPTPLIGQSEPIKINTASAYGRYRQALNTLRELKKKVDETLSKGNKSLPKEARELSTKAAQQAEKSPFFDGLDRVTIMRFGSRVAGLETSNPGAAEGIMTLSQELNDFLFEHEILDDRERDRDFFVAARALSRLIEQNQVKRPVALKTVTARLKKFLDDRLERWAKRVERLPKASVPPKWKDVKGKVFQGSMDEIDKLEDRNDLEKLKIAANQLENLSKSVVSYRAWIEELEAKEDQAREKEESERQEGLASARNVLRELQQRQGKITQYLDRSEQRSRADMEAVWPKARLEQNANTKEARRLEGQMRSLSPNAGVRIQAAIKAMEGTSEYGGSGNYVLAESNSDMAGRLLRQAEKDTQESQQKRRSRGRRRRVTGDNYYGQSVVGGDVEIKREYEVDRRYREAILDEVQNTGADDEQRTLLENYLRHVVR
jgi:hypothetical protein